MKMTIKNFLFVCLTLGVFFASCTNDDPDVNDFLDESVYLIESETRSGKRGCYELVKPITILFTDGTSTEVEDFKGLKEAIISWKSENPDGGKPQLQYPIELLTDEGEVIAVESREEMRELRKECRASMGFGTATKPCFIINYPVQLNLPNGESVEVINRRSLKRAIRSWKINNLESEERPTLEFPIEITLLDDESVMTINSREELKAVKEDCRN